MGPRPLSRLLLAAGVAGRGRETGDEGEEVCLSLLRLQDDIVPSESMNRK